MADEKSPDTLVIGVPEDAWKHMAFVAKMCSLRWIFRDGERVLQWRETREYRNPEGGGYHESVWIDVPTASECGMQGEAESGPT